ncbi:DUF846-domain-containing protein [Neocallimastix lanati (nom. inval.)]|jgi:hypothetical protein|nr:DUF846-domain-containing protein [Neocallimastix sp. JGI-2020a]
MYNSDTTNLMSDQGPAGGDVLSMLEGQTMSSYGNNNSNNNNNNSTNNNTNGGSESIFKTSSHPVALFFHLFFRTAAIVLYIIPFLHKNNYVISFVVITMLLAFDFWTVKNISGRLLVGLRWWNEINEDGTNSWLFESKDNRVVNKTDSRVFWGALYIAPLVWLLFALMSLLSLSFKWLLVDIVALSFNIANLIGYYKCEKDAKQKLGGFLGNNSMVQSMIGSVISNKVGSVFGRN